MSERDTSKSKSRYELNAELEMLRNNDKALRDALEVQGKDIHSKIATIGALRDQVAALERTRVDLEASSAGNRNALKDEIERLDRARRYAESNADVWRAKAEAFEKSLRIVVSRGKEEEVPF